MAASFQDFLTWASDWLTDGGGPGRRPAGPLLDKEEGRESEEQEEHCQRPEHHRVAVVVDEEAADEDGDEGADVADPDPETRDPAPVLLSGDIHQHRVVEE